MDHAPSNLSKEESTTTDRGASKFMGIIAILVGMGIIIFIIFAIPRVLLGNGLF